MHYVAGQYVRLPSRPDWGIGKVVNLLSDEKLRVYFFQAQEYRALSTKYAKLEIVDHVSVSLPTATVGRKVDMQKITPLCESFYSEMTTNRPNCDDGGLALDIMKDLQSRGELTGKTRKRLLRWCHTDGHLYQRGAEIARKICIEIYGCIPPRDS